MRVCFYHNDLDGICSAAIVRKANPAKIDEPDTEVKCIPCDYGKEPNPREYPDADIFLVDFTFDRKTMEWLIKRDNFVWIDHHKTAGEKHPDIWNDKNIKGNRGTAMAACEYTWKYFFPKEMMPPSVASVGDVDMWEFDVEHSLEFFEAVNAVIDDPYAELWSPLLHRFNYGKKYRELIEHGKTLLIAKTKRVKQTFKDGYDGCWHGHKTRFMNTNHDISDCGNYAVKQGYPLAFIWYLDNNFIRVGLRSGTVDVSEIAKKHGGGGHKAAAGFQLTFNEFEEHVLDEIE